MKQETKELVEFIKDCVFRYQTELNLGKVDVGMIDGEEEDKTCDKAITFLDSLPEIESHLCRGGYIQDRNGIPCCDGELVYFLSKSQKEKYGYLIWDKKMAWFVIEVVAERDCKYIMSELEWF